MTHIAPEQVEHLRKSEHIVDDSGITRPVFEIAGRDVIFRTSQELPTFDMTDRPYRVASIADATPLELAQQTSHEAFSQFVAASAEVAPHVLDIVTATPEGLVGAAIEMGSTNEQLGDIQQSLRSGRYSADAIKLIDTMMAALYFNGDGEKLDAIDTDGHALVLRSLLDDEPVSTELESRVEQMYYYFDAQHAKSAAELGGFPERMREIESLDPRMVALVHNTSHQVDISEDGSVMLRPASAFRKDKFPRSSLHFTPNGSVTDHYARTDAKSSRYVVGNFAAMVNANDRLPASMCSADTYFTLNPGASLKIPDARIVEGSLDATELMTQVGSIITYKDSNHYTEQESREIRQLARSSGLDTSRGMTAAGTLRSLALLHAMEQSGAERFVEIGSHYALDSKFQDQYTKLAGELAVSTALHENTGDARLETNAYYGMNYEFSRAHSSSESYGTFLPDTTIEALRQVIASGYIPGRPFADAQGDDDTSAYF